MKKYSFRESWDRIYWFQDYLKYWLKITKWKVNLVFSLWWLIDKLYMITGVIDQVNETYTHLLTIVINNS